MQKAVDRLSAATRDPSEAAQRLSYAQTTVCIELEGTAQGITLLLDRDPVEVVDRRADCEVRLTLSDAQLEQFSRGDLLVQAALLHGDATHSGPVWKFLRVMPILGRLLRGDQGGGADVGPLPPEQTPSAAPAPGGLWTIECRDVHKRFGAEQVLNGVDLTIPEGLITIVVGPSGTGKSVLLKHIMGLLTPDRGDVLIRGESACEMSHSELLSLRRRYGVLFQDGALWSSMSVYDNVAFPLRQHTDLSESEIADIVTSRLDDVGLSGAETAVPDQLSGGMRKRAGLARALVLEPEILLFDEPDSGLDPVRTALLCDLISQVHGEYGGTFVVITHDIAVARRIGQYMAALWQGEIVAQGFSRHVFASDDPFVRQFLAGEPHGPLGME